MHSESLTVKLRGRVEAADQNRGCTLSSSTRANPPASHGRLQRLLDVVRRSLKRPFNCIFVKARVLGATKVFDELAKRLTFRSTEELEAIARTNIKIR